MQTYTVETSFTFTGTFEVKAQTKDEAIEIVEKHCGLVMGGNIHTTLPKEVVKDWNFPAHPDKKVVSIM